jgi:hypothetical protein
MGQYRGIRLKKLMNGKRNLSQANLSLGSQLHSEAPDG